NPTTSRRAGTARLMTTVIAISTQLAQGTRRIGTSTDSGITAVSLAISGRVSDRTSSNAPRGLVMQAPALWLHIPVSLPPIRRCPMSGDRKVDPTNLLPESTPYGPRPHGVDEASGGADSSPFENEPSGEKAKAAQKSKEQRQATPDDGGD